MKNFEDPIKNSVEQEGGVENKKMDKIEFIGNLSRGDQPTEITFTNKEGKKGVIKVQEVGIKDGDDKFQSSLARVNINGEDTSMYLDDLYDNYYSEYHDKSENVSIEYN